MSTLSIVTTCKSRLAHLQQTLPQMKAARPDEIIVVDYSCPQNTRGWLASNHPDVKCVAVEGQVHFNRSKARNIGWKAATSEWVAFVDADVMLMPGWREWWEGHAHASQLFFRHDVPEAGNRGSFGSCVVRREHVQALEGYDEFFAGWGGEDDDFFHRLSRAAARPALIPQPLMSAIEHGDTDRVKHSVIGSKFRSFVFARYYRSAKDQAMTFFRSGGELDFQARQQINAQLQRAFEPFLLGQSKLPPAIELKLVCDEGLTPEMRMTKTTTIRLEAGMKTESR